MQVREYITATVKRFLLLLLSLVSYLFLLVLDLQRYLPAVKTTNGQVPVQSWLLFGFSALVAFLFMAVGNLVWRYAQDRRVALLLYCFSFTMMVTFTVETGATLDPLLSALSAASSALAFAPFAILLLLFPHNFLDRTQPTTGVRGNWIRFLLRIYVTVLIALSVLAVVNALLLRLTTVHLPDWFNITSYSYFLLASGGILGTLLISYRTATSLRQRQQLRLFVVGVVTAFTPGLFFTILPLALHLPSQVMVNSQVSTLTVILLPLTLGYTILRYQILISDASIRQAAAWIMGCLGLIVLIYLAILVYGAFFSSSASTSVIVPVSLVALISPGVWYIMRSITERYFFSEIWHYRRLLEQPDLLARENLNLEEASQLLTVAVGQAFETEAVCLFVLEKELGRFILAPTLSPTDLRNAARFPIQQRIVNATNVREAEQVSWLDAKSPLLKNLIAASRPMYLNETRQERTENRMERTRFLATRGSSADENDLLLAPVWSKGEVIGILALGERGDRQHYAGPDFEAISLILSRYASDLESARLTRDLRIAYEHQKELDQLKDQFIVTASHELRTPLTAVQGYLELLGDFDEDIPREDRAAFLKIARNSCDELALMVANIMDVGRVQFETEHIRVNPLLLASAVAQSAEIFEALLRREQRTLRVSIPASIQVMADDMRLRQVMLNLIGNAFKYSPQGSPVEISADLLDNVVVVRVRDYGAGVPVEDQGQLFQRFMRLERDLNSPVRGAGLGLFICKQLIDAMDGRIWVESTGISGEGSTFAFTLPLAIVDAVREDVDPFALQEQQIIDPIGAKGR